MDRWHKDNVSDLYLTNSIIRLFKVNDLKAVVLNKKGLLQKTKQSSIHYI